MQGNQTAFRIGGDPLSFTITKEIYSEYDDGSSTTLLRAEIACDSAADLPAPNAVTGITLLMGCEARDISTGDLYRMKSDGSWVRQPVAQADAYTTTQTDALLSERIPYDITDIISSGDDLDNYIMPGSWRCTNSGVANYPGSSQGRLDVIQIDSTNGLMQQQLHCTGSTTRVFIRNMSATSPPAWHPWIELNVYGRTGSSIPSGSDLNDYRTPGKYYSPSVSASQNTINRPDYTPTGNVRFFMTIDVGATSTMFIQTLYAVDVSTANYGALRLFRRIGNSSTWGSWYETTLTPIGSHT
jgi:hypothetical protein